MFHSTFLSLNSYHSNMRSLSSHLMYSILLRLSGPIYYLFTSELKTSVVLTIICQLNNERYLNQKLEGNVVRINCVLNTNSWWIKQSLMNIFYFLIAARQMGYKNWSPANRAKCCHDFGPICSFHLSYSLNSTDRKHKKHWY